MEEQTNLIINHQPTNLEVFDTFYKQLMSQILDELGRRKMIRKLSTDSTPIKPEKELMEVIKTVLMRFDLYDKDYCIGYGYLISNVNDVTADTLQDLVQSQYDFPISTKIHSLELYTISTYKQNIDQLLKELDNIGPMIESYPYPEGVNHEPANKTHPDFKCDAAARRVIDNKFKSKHTIFGCKTEVSVPITYFNIYKSLAINKYLRDANITTASVVEMLWGDLIDKAIQLEAMDQK